MSKDGKLYALLIGVNDYASRALRNLRYAVADVLEFRQLLTERMGLAAERCLLLTGPQVAGAEHPGRSSILSAFDRLANLKLTERDTLVCYFAGHGFSVEGETFLMARDSQPGSRRLLQETAVPLSLLKGFLRHVPSGQQLLILDACRNDPQGLGRGVSEAAMKAAMTRDIAALVKPDEEKSCPARDRRAITVLNACNEGQVSFEAERERHGWFCAHLLRTLRESPGGRLQLTPHWVESLGDRMREGARLHFPEAVGQTPYFELSGKVLELVLRPLPSSGRRLSTGPDPDQVRVKEAEIQPITIRPQTVAAEQVEVAGLPPIPGDVLELEGRVKGLEEAVEQIEAGTHPSLEPAQEAVRQVEQQFEELNADLEAHEPRLDEETREKVTEEALRQPPVSAGSLCDLAPGLDPTELLPYVQRLRNVDRARRSMEKAMAEFAAAREQELRRLRVQHREMKEVLEKRKCEDLKAVLDHFFETAGDPEDFPLAAWNEFAPDLLKRRYPWPVREIIGRAEACLRERLHGQCPRGRRGRRRIGVFLGVACCAVISWWLVDKNLEESQSESAPGQQGNPAGRTEPRRGVLSRVEEAVEADGRKHPALATKEQPWENSLGMRFVPVPGTEVLFSVWETRVKDYAVYAAENPAVDDSWRDPKFGGHRVTPTEDCPVVNVSWEDAKAFCEWLTKKDRVEGRLSQEQRYRLPTDEDWSWAVGIGDQEQAGTPREKDMKLKGVYPWGTQWPPPKGVGNFMDDTAGRIFSGFGVIAGYDDGYATTAPVGSFAANERGLYDLSGNVWEWCAGFYDGRSGSRVLRGGSWNFFGPDYVLASYRFFGPPGFRVVSVGCRCVLEVSRE